MPRCLLAVPIVLLLSATLWAPNARAVERSGDYETQLLSRAADGGFPNGPSRNGVLSQDGRVARTAAFESDASNIVAGDSNGLTDVFVVDRTAGYSEHRLAVAQRPDAHRLPRDRRTRERALVRARHLGRLEL